VCTGHADEVAGGGEGTDFGWSLEARAAGLSVGAGGVRVEGGEKGDQVGAEGGVERRATVS